MEMFKGKNGVPVGDNGDCWRAFGSSNVRSPQVYDYMSHNGPTGIKYGMGFDSVVNGTRIAFVDYPKTLYTIDEIIDGEDTPTMLNRCNVCSAMDQATQRTGKVPYERDHPSLPVQQVRSDLYSSPSVPERLSLGPAAAATLPKWIPALFKVAKPLALKPTGDALFTFGLSMLADLASGFAPPAYQKALQAFSDDMIDTIDPKMAENIKMDALNIAEAALKDGDSVVSRKFLSNAMFKTRGDIKNEIEKSRSNMQQSSSSPHRSGQVNEYSPRPTGVLNVPRLWE